MCLELPYLLLFLSSFCFLFSFFCARGALRFGLGKNNAFYLPASVFLTHQHHLVVSSQGFLCQKHGLTRCDCIGVRTYTEQVLYFFLEFQQLFNVKLLFSMFNGRINDTRF